MKIETYEEAVKARVDRVKEEMETGRLDPELYDILIDLNKKGYFTASSCAGHSRGDGARGSIAFATREMYKAEYHIKAEGILYLLQSYSLNDIQLSKFRRRSGGPGTVATFEPIGSQYGNGLYDTDWQDSDYCFDVPPRPDKCPNCGSSDLWIHGELYDIEDTLEWMCKHCQPLPFNSDRACLTPEISKRREELPKLKLWEVEDQGTGKTFQVRAKNQHNIYKRLGVSPYDCEVFIRRVK